MNLHDMKLLAVEDDEAILLLFERLLQRAGYNHVTLMRNPRPLRGVFERLQPDLLLLDLHLPYIDGFEVMAELKKLVPYDSYFPILAISADPRQEIKNRSLASDAKDFIAKPFDPTELLLRVQNLLETRALSLRAQRQREQLEPLSPP